MYDITYIHRRSKVISYLLSLTKLQYLVLINSSKLEVFFDKLTDISVLYNRYEIHI